jgi:hypothetical protein
LPVATNEQRWSQVRRRRNSQKSLHAWLDDLPASLLATSSSFSFRKRGSRLPGNRAWPPGHWPRVLTLSPCRRSTFPLTVETYRLNSRRGE